MHEHTLCWCVDKFDRFLYQSVLSLLMCLSGATCIILYTRLCVHWFFQQTTNHMHMPHTILLASSGFHCFMYASLVMRWLGARCSAHVQAPLIADTSTVVGPHIHTWSEYSIGCNARLRFQVSVVWIGVLLYYSSNDFIRLFYAEYK